MVEMGWLSDGFFGSRLSRDFELGVGAFAASALYGYDSTKIVLTSKVLYRHPVTGGKLVDIPKAILQG